MVLGVSEPRKRPDSTVPPVTGAPAVSRTLTPQAPQSPTSSLAVAQWLRERGIYPAAGKHWRVQIALEVNNRPASFGFAPTKLLVTIDPSSWGYVFTHGDRTSTIHVTSYPTARDGDEHRLLAMTPPLKRFGSLVRDLEARYRIFFPRHHAAIRSDLPGGEPMIRAWISSL